MIKFMKSVSDQMGVKLFVLAGFRNEEGEAMKMRYGSVIILIDICSMPGQDLKQNMLTIPQSFRSYSRSTGNMCGRNGINISMTCSKVSSLFYGHLIHDSNPLLAAAPDQEETDIKGPVTDKSVRFSLEIGDDGWPLLPDSSDITLPQMKDIVRSYLTMIYSKSRSDCFFLII